MNQDLKKLLDLRPGLAKLVAEKGNLTVDEYLKSITKYAEELDPDVTKVINKNHNLKTTKNIIHTTDHIGLLNHPFFWSSKASSHDGEMIVFATSNISPTNSSFPRGIVWHDKDLIEKRANLLPLSWRRHPMYGVPALNKSKLISFTNALPNKLREVFQTVVESKDISKCKWLSQQLCLMNQDLWRSCFGNSKDLLYFELESVINELIADGINQKSSNIYNLLTNPKVLSQYVKIFDGIPGAHNSETGQGSHLFWYINHTTQKRLSLTQIDNFLVTSDGIKIELDPAVILDKLEDRTIMPTLSLSYSLLAVEYGAVLTGGFSQIDYLPKMIKAWNELFSTAKFTKGDLFAGELGLVSLVNNHKNVLATLSDLLIYCDNVNERIELMSQSSNSSLTECISNISNDLLRIVEPARSKTSSPLASGRIYVD
jgi:hypothetical protein